MGLLRSILFGAFPMSSLGPISDFITSAPCGGIFYFEEPHMPGCGCGTLEPFRRKRLWEPMEGDPARCHPIRVSAGSRPLLAQPPSSRLWVSLHSHYVLSSLPFYSPLTPSAQDCNGLLETGGIFLL